MSMSASLVGHPIGPMGWGQENPHIPEIRLFEARFIERAIEGSPEVFSMRDSQELKPVAKAKFDKIQSDCGRGPDSCDLTLLDYAMLGHRLNWWPQDGGTCVWSNTFRIIVARMMYEIGLRGDGEEFFGTDEQGIRTIAPHCVQYGLARQIANMRNGDGLYAGPMAKSLAKGMVMCSNPKLIELMRSAGADKDSDYPEPRNLSLYRKIGDWAFNDALRDYIDNPVLEIPPVANYDTHFELSHAGKPIFQCSGIAIKRVGTHKDGFTIHELDPSNSWAHNMGWMGHFYSVSDGTLWYRLSNKSWLQRSEHVDTDVPKWSDPEEKYVYNISAEHLMTWYKKKLVDSFGIGEIKMPESLPATI